VRGRGGFLERGQSWRVALTFLLVTGGGSTRISSNLYNDGKVCISVLGTANASNDAQRWNPQTSSLAQVLASLQVQLLSDPEPYFSDGFGHETVRGTDAGKRGSERHNAKVRLHTLRHAIIAPLKDPSIAFEEVIKRHFVLCRKRLLVQARLWTMEAEGSNLSKAFKRAYEEILTLLSRDDFVTRRRPGQNQDQASVWGAVPIYDKDLVELVRRDVSFADAYKMAAASATATARTLDMVIQNGSPGRLEQPSASNPWAAGVGGPRVENRHQTDQGTVEHDDGFNDIYS
jgi:Ubiquitin-conjugating enzyme